MLSLDFTAALRRIFHDRLHSILGVVSLGLGIAAFIASHLFSSHLQHYDEGFTNANRAYVIAQSVEIPNAGVSLHGYTSSIRLAEQLRISFPELAAITRYVWSRVSITAGAESSSRMIAYVDPEFFEIFDFHPIAGDLRTAISTPGSIVLTARTANALFGRTDVVGKTLTLTSLGRGDVTVTAVIANLPEASHLSAESLAAIGFEALASWDVYEAVGKRPGADNWVALPAVTYALLPASGMFTVKDLAARLPEVVVHNIPQEGLSVALEPRPISSVAMQALQLEVQGFHGALARIDVFDALAGLTSLLLWIACLNFVNLATAQSIGRATSVAVRRILGASSAQIIRQDLIQTGVLVTAATVLALAAITPISRLLTGPWVTPFSVPWMDGRFWWFLGTLLLAVTLLAGLYPAVILTRIRPTRALRVGLARAGTSSYRAIFVGMQFAAASFLTAVVFVVFAQQHELRAALLDRFTDPYVGLDLGRLPVDPNVAITELARGSGIKGATAMSDAPWGVRIGSERRLARLPKEGSVQVKTEDRPVGYDFFDVMSVPVLAGRTFSWDRADDLMPSTREEFAAHRGQPLTIVLDRTATRALGWSDPRDAVGATLESPNMPAFQVIGVVEDAPLGLRSNGNVGTSYVANPRQSRFILLRVDKNAVAGAIEHVNSVIASLAGDRASQVQPMFLDELFDNAYRSFAVIGGVVTSLALFALAIAAIGLFSMASYLTRTRTRELGIRKTQGASQTSIVRLLLWDFSRPVVIANIAAWPLGLYVAGRYLDVFAQRISLTSAPFLLALMSTILVAWVAVASFALRAARQNPARALRER